MKLAFEIGKELILNEDTKRTVQDFFPVSASPGEGFFKFFWLIIRNVYVLTGIVLFFMIVIGGVGMIANAGNAEKQKQSSQTLSSAVIGFVIMLAAYWIVKILEIITGLQLL